mgnify:CR=1 FL=1
MAAAAIHVKVVKQSKVVFLLVGLEESVESVRRRVVEFFPGVAAADCMMLRGELILNDDATVREQGIENGDVIRLRFYVSGRGEGYAWDAPED